MKNNKRIFITEKIEGTLKKVSRQQLSKIPTTVLKKNNIFRIVNKTGKQKLTGSKIPLEFLKLNDELVQKVICQILETVWKSYFFKPSFIFYPMFKTSNLFNCIESKLFWINEIIENPSSTINIVQFCSILNKKIQDDRLINLIYQLLRYEALEYCQFFQSNLGTFQKSITLSIFINIYFNELDNWIKYKTCLLTQPLFHRHDKISDQSFYQVKKKVKQKQKLNKTSKKYKIIQKKLTSLGRKESKITDFSKQQINYFRSLNNWVIGIKGDKFLIEKLKIEINHFLIIYLKQRIYSTKIRAVVLPYKKVKFVGYQMCFLNNRKTYYCIQYSNKTNHPERLKIKFNVPISFIFQKMEKESYLRKLTPDYQSSSKINYMGSEKIITIKHFTQVWRGLLNYYSECNSSSKLQSIHYNFYLSFIVTLSYTHSSNIKMILTKHGRMLKTFKNGIIINFPYRIF